MSLATAVANATEMETYKGVTLNTQVTLTLDVADLQELREALASHASSWETRSGKDKANTHWSHKATQEEGTVLLVGGKAKARFNNRSMNKTQLKSKFDRIVSLRAKLNTL